MRLGRPNKGQGITPVTFPSDERLMRAIQEGRFDLLGVLFERYHGQALGLCTRMVRDRSLADDLVQEAFIRVLRYRDTFKDPAVFSAWLYRIVRNVCLDKLSALDREAAALDRAEWVLGDGAERCPWGGAEDERIPLVRAAFARLPEEQRRILTLKRVFGLPYREIADQYGCSEGAMRVRAHRALEELRTLVKELESEVDEG